MSFLAWNKQAPTGKRKAGAPAGGWKKPKPTLTKLEARRADHPVHVRLTVTAGGVQVNVELHINQESPACKDLAAWRRAVPLLIQLHACGQYDYHPHAGPQIAIYKPSRPAAKQPMPEGTAATGSAALAVKPRSQREQNRRFQSKWLTNATGVQQERKLWLVERAGKMLCVACEQYNPDKTGNMVVGSISMKETTADWHYSQGAKNGHHAALLTMKENTAMADQMMQSLSRQINLEEDKIVSVISNAYFIGKRNLSMNLAEALAEHMELNGVHVLMKSYLALLPLHQVMGGCCYLHHLALSPKPQ
jgi:hypothetical protein